MSCAAAAGASSTTAAASVGGGQVMFQVDASTVSGAPPGWPTTCADAVDMQSYIGCDFWPTVTFNPVWSIFDFAAVVANAQTVAATIQVTGPNGVNQMATVEPNSLTTIYLPWVPTLKGPDFDSCGFIPALTASVTAPGGAYHLVSSVPVSVYQFNALEYQGKGGAPEKNWGSCPGTTTLCILPTGGGYVGCFSYSNDASILLPSSAMTGNYRVTGQQGATLGVGGFFAVTAIADNTQVTVTLSNTATVLAGNGITAGTAGGQLAFAMNSGDVVEILGQAQDGVDLSGSYVSATAPVQVLAGTQCSLEPAPAVACDHLESSVLPAETLGKDYVVTVPTAPNAAVVGHMVRFFGNVDGTTLTYSPSQPPGCPSTLNAGQVVQCTGVPRCATGIDSQGDPAPITCVNQTFEVTGSEPFAVSSFMLAGSAIDPTPNGNSEGDPSMSPIVATEQYLSKYIFLAPSDYDQSYADIVVPPGTTLTLDGAPVTTAPVVLNAQWSIVRTPLGAGQNGAHVLSGTKPFGVQVIGYGAYTSYQYPAGLNLVHIAQPR
ncbi:MAG: IgGFc-binding protein [Polyangiaceae bacterium]